MHSLYVGPNPSLDGTIKNHFKESLRNQKWPNHFPGTFTLNVFTITNLFSHIYQFSCTNIWLEIYFGICEN